MVSPRQDRRFNARTGSVDLDHLTRPGAALGTAAHMSPERAKGKESQAREAMCSSFSAMLYADRSILIYVARASRPMKPSWVSIFIGWNHLGGIMICSLGV